MPLLKLDHVNIITANLDDMVAWYTDVLGMVDGDRPPFPFPGAWLYVEEDALVHLVGSTDDRQSIEPNIEHFAISATGLAEFLERLEQRGVAYDMNTVPDFPIVQVNVLDCDGNHIHVDFPAAELTEDLAKHLRG